MFSNARLGNEFWVKVVSIAFYLVNKYPSTVIEYKVPKEVCLVLP